LIHLGYQLGDRSRLIKDAELCVATLQVDDDVVRDTGANVVTGVEAPRATDTARPLTRFMLMS